MSWWKRKTTPEEEALAYAALQLRMAKAGLTQGSVNELDRGAARIIGEALDTMGFALVKVERPSWGNADASPGRPRHMWSQPELEAMAKGLSGPPKAPA